MADFCGLDIKNSKIIVCHLGNGASISAVVNGKSMIPVWALHHYQALLWVPEVVILIPPLSNLLLKRE